MASLTKIYSFSNTAYPTGFPVFQGNHLRLTYEASIRIMKPIINKAAMTATIAKAMANLRLEPNMMGKGPIKMMPPHSVLPLPFPSSSFFSSALDLEVKEARERAAIVMITPTHIREKPRRERKSKRLKLILVKMAKGKIYAFRLPSLIFHLL